MAQKIFGCETTQDSSETEQVFQRVQTDLTRPASPATYFIPGLGHLAKRLGGLQLATRAIDNSGVHFSPDLVALEIKGPEYLKLSFCDLPGVVATPASPHD